MSVTTAVLAGVGGQGTILAGDVLARSAVAEGYDVKLSEVHGMAQRGGSVQTVVRFGDTVHSPIVDPGTADLLIAFEVIEAARALPLLRPGGHFVVNKRTLPSLPMLTGDVSLTVELETALHAEGAIFVDAEALGCEAGNLRSANIVLLGAASIGLPFSDETWRSVIENRVPQKSIKVNIKAFELGRRACEKGVTQL